MTAAFNKFSAFSNSSFGLGAVALASDTLNIMFTKPASPPPSIAAVYGDVSSQEIASGNGYPLGGLQALQASSGLVGVTYTLKLSNVTLNALGAIGPFRYIILYSTKTTVLPKPLIGWWDYGSPITLSEGEPFTVAFDSALGVVTLQ